jgi:protein ImuB
MRLSIDADELNPPSPQTLPGTASSTQTQAPGVLLWRDDPRQGRIVMAYCGYCRRAGVRLGMSVVQAVELARPGQVCIHDPGGDTESLETIARQISQNISPMVATESLDPQPWAGHWRHQSESLLVDITGVDHLFSNLDARAEMDDALSGEIGLVRTTFRLCHAMNLHPRIAVADTPAAAWALAHYANHHLSEIFAHGRHLPDVNAWIASRNHGIAPLLPLPIESLRLPESTVATLHRLGITNIGELLRLPRSGLASRLGKELMDRIDQITDQLAEPITIYDAPPEHQSQCDLEYPTADVDILSHRLRQCVNEIQTSLAIVGRGAQCITCRLDLSDHPPLTFDVGLFAPSRDVDHLHGLLVHHLESVSLKSEVVRLTLAIVLSSPMRTQQNALFDYADDSTSKTRWQNDPLVARLIDSIAGRLGRTAVVQPHWTPDPLPESVVVDIPLCGHPQVVIKKRSTNPSSRSSNSRDYKSNSHGQGFPRKFGWGPSISDAMRRPLSLLDRPQPILVPDGTGRFIQRILLSVDATAQDLIWDPPSRFQTGGVIHRVSRFWGPERIETNWWNGAPVARDYFRVETHSNSWLWIFRILSTADADPASASQDRKNGVQEIAWFLHGRFA